MKKQIVYCCSVAILAMTSCSKSDLLHTTKQSKSDFSNVMTSTYEATDLLQSIIFRTGPLAANLTGYPTYDEMVVNCSDAYTKTKLQEATHDYHQLVSNYIATRNQAFLDDFKQKVTSGDPALAYSAIQSAQNDFATYVSIPLTNPANPNETYARMSDPEVFNNVPDPSGFKPDWLWYSNDVAVVSVAVVAVALVAVIHLIDFTPIVVADGDVDSALQMEEYALAVSNTYNTNP